MPPVGFETTIAAGERPHTYALDCAATGTGTQYWYIDKYVFLYVYGRIITKNGMSSIIHCFKLIISVILHR
jgi:hypothetical protein